MSETWKFQVGMINTNSSLWLLDRHQEVEGPRVAALSDQEQRTEKMNEELLYGSQFQRHVPE
jgi:hypothetical protein